MKVKPRRPRIFSETELDAAWEKIRKEFFPERGKCLECGTKKNLVKGLTYNNGDICKICWKAASDRLGPIGGSRTCLG